jgi:photosystem II stability/assembly factor-like uncharacterized protein
MGKGLLSLRRFSGTQLKFRHSILLTPMLLAAGLLVTVVSVSAADNRWTPTGAQQPATADRPVWSFSVSPAHPATMLAASEGHGVLRSSDSGSTWTSVIPGVDKAWVVRFDPKQPLVAYAGTQTAGLFKSTDEGKTWTPQLQGLTNLDIRSIDVASGLVVLGTAQGVFYSNDAAASWHALGLESLSIAAVALLPKTDGVTIFAGADNGAPGPSSLLKNEGLTPSWDVVKGNFPGDAIVASLAVALAPSGGSAPPVLAGSSAGVYRSDDRGVSWTVLAGLPATDFNAVLFNPANADQIYVASDGDQGNGGVFRSLDRGATWTTFGTGLPSKPRVTALALQPLNPAEVVAATWNPTDGSAGAFRIADTAATVAGVTPTAAPSGNASVPAIVRPTLPAPAPIRRSAGSPSYQAYAIALAAILAMAIVVLARRWRLRREDRRTYSP